ncbi:YjbH domain-containing protein [Sedimentitalea todarodis]|uniref:YjbH domain-containing protein n=1 Tax=Sedimentitalea todarodis TaxID=1631240 RepID=A0ABU3VKQ6_9RHOB|nr:YjbH domain-containing protein [Sedimentitalea todarodis]MDU9006565.1 YjbH domain-containing protein [Sedimentitalea todarodis]
MFQAFFNKTVSGVGPVFRSGPGRALVVVLLGGALAGGAALAQSQSGAGARRDAEPTLVPLPPPSLNFYGSPGIIDMPSAEMLPDGQFTTGVSSFGGQTRYNLTFQATPWMSATFRYNSIQDWNMGGFDTYYDRSFDLRFRLLRERKYIPEVTVGLQDFVGTGIYAGEYVVATKRFEVPGWGGRFGETGRLKLTAGIGWGRLGSYGSIGSSGDRPPYDPTSLGGEPAYDQWFRGPYAPFAGIEWQPNEKLGLKLEYSSDDYVTETQDASIFERRSPFNFGVEYQVSPRTRLGAYYMYGSQFGVNLQIQLNPKQPVTQMRIPAPQPIPQRPSQSSNPDAWTTAWTGNASVPAQLRDLLAPILLADGLVLESLTVRADTAELRFRNIQYLSFANAVGRAARAMSRVMPPSVETFRLVPLSGGMALSATTVRRSDLEALEFDGNATDALLAVTAFSDAPPLSADATPAADLYPDKSWSLSPYFSPAYFDPEQPFRVDVGLTLRGTYRPAPGWIISGAIRQRLAGNVDGGPPSNSVLPHVRTDQVEYAQYGTTLNNLFIARQWRPGRNLYARVTGGYLETMYGGLSTELLWKPVSSNLALGVEANYVKKRDFNQRLGFQDYEVFTGHGTAYYEFAGGYLAQLSVGQYLAGDVGATLSVDRTFDNGWMVGAFATKTNVSAEDFGEGSFDKGIRFRIPINWFLGKPSQQTFGTTIRPVQRDGGQMVSVPGRLYGQVRLAHRKALTNQWARVWE